MNCPTAIPHTPVPCFTALNLFRVVQNFALIQSGKVDPLAVVLLARKYQPHCDLYISWRIASMDKLLNLSSALCTSYYRMRSMKLTETISNDVIFHRRHKPTVI